jgi:hypothetical protein
VNRKSIISGFAEYIPCRQRQVLIQLEFHHRATMELSQTARVTTPPRN